MSMTVDEALKYAEETLNGAFEEWLSLENPHGDCESVQRQWDDSAMHEDIVAELQPVMVLTYEVKELRAELHSAREEMKEWQTRAEAAEEELRKAREQEPVAYRIDWSDGLVELAWQADGYDEDYVEIRGLPTAVPLGEMPCAAPKPAALAVPDALRMELEWLEGWLHCMAEPMGQACCKRSMFECCGYPDPVYPDIAHIGTAMSKRRNDVIALLQSADHSEQAHEMVDAVNRRCEACAILPCSCK